MIQIVVTIVEILLGNRDDCPSLPVMWRLQSNNKNDYDIIKNGDDDLWFDETDVGFSVPGHSETCHNTLQEWNEI